MTKIFEVIDKSGRKVYLTKERWVHITSPGSQHPYMANYLEEMKETVIKPDFVRQSNFDESKFNYFKYIKEKKQYLLVGVKYLNGEGFITTAFIARKLQRK